MKKVTVFLGILAFTASACSISNAEEGVPVTKSAIFAGGCFWCMEPPFEKIPGVSEVISGFSGGTKENPTYDEVSAGQTDHYEVVKVVYDPKKVSYDTLLATFWMNIDPFQGDGQFCDRGKQYRSAVFFGSPEEKDRAQETSRIISEDFEEDVVTEVRPVGTFHPAEEYHQDFYKKNPDRYYSYRAGCKRDNRLMELWGDKEPWVQRLTSRTKGPLRKQQ